MQKTSLRYGLFSGSVLVIFFLVKYFFTRDSANWEVQEVIGYIGIVLSLLFVYFGIRHWRDEYNEGRLTFGQGFKLGILITLFPAIAFGVFSWLQMNVIDPGFLDRYYGYYVEKVKASTPPGQVEAALKDLETQKEMFASPFMQFFAMFMTVMLVGIVITVIASLILQRRQATQRAMAV